MERERLVVVNIDEIATRWQIPVERVKYLIVECGLDPTHTGDWVVKHWDLWISEKRKAKDDLLFPKKFQVIPPKAISTKTF